MGDAFAVVHGVIEIDAPHGFYKQVELRPLRQSGQAERGLAAAAVQAT